MDNFIVAWSVFFGSLYELRVLRVRKQDVPVENIRKIAVSGKWSVVHVLYAVGVFWMVWAIPVLPRAIAAGLLMVSVVCGFLQGFAHSRLKKHPKLKEDWLRDILRIDNQICLTLLAVLAFWPLWHIFKG